MTLFTWSRVRHVRLITHQPCRTVVTRGLGWVTLVLANGTGHLLVGTGKTVETGRTGVTVDVVCGSRCFGTTSADITKKEWKTTVILLTNY